MRSLAVAALLTISCSNDVTTPRGAVALYDTSSTRSEFFALPWPSDARLTSEGKLDLAGFNNPGGGLGKYLSVVAADALGGFGTQAAVYFRFDAAIDPASLPVDAAASLKPEATAFLVDTTPASPTFGQRSPVRAHFVADAGLYIGANWLALLPEPGFPLRPRTTYTAVLTDGISAADGGRVRPDKPFDASRFPSVPGVDHARFVSATSFTTQDPTSIMRDLRAAVQQTPAPTVSDLAWKVTDGDKLWDEYTGTYPSPNFQEGEPPYQVMGGRIHLDGGKPAPVRTEQLRFAVTVPRGDMPAAGWPVVLYAHGTGGSYESFIEDGSAASAATVLDFNGNAITHLAMVSIDQVLHGPRDPSGGSPDTTFFNVTNIVATRDNPKQGALDDFQLMRFVQGFSVAAAPTTGVPIKFDVSRIYFKGHSQGGLTGPLFLAYEPDVKAAVLSGAGGGFIFSLLYKTQPVNIPRAIAAILNETPDEYHPLLNLLQVFFESSDPTNYAKLFFREPPTGMTPKSIFQSLGIVDHYTPIPTIKTLALAMGVQPVNPALDPLPDLDLASLTWGTAPLKGNVAGGKASGVLCEYKAISQDGHFVVFDIPAAIRQSNEFLGTHALTGTATLVR